MLARNVLTKTPARELHKSIVKVKKIPPPILYQVATSNLNGNKSQISGFHKTPDKRTGNIRTYSSDKS